MQLTKYVTTLLPSFSKTRMMEDLNVLREELKLTVIPPYKSVNMAFGKHKWTDEAVKAFEKDFDKQVDSDFRGSFIAVSEQILERMLKNTDMVEKLIADYYADDVMRDAMTFLKVNIIQYLETMSFVANYSRRCLHWVVSSECTAVGDDKTPALVPAELEWLSANRSNYFTAMTIMAGKPTDVEKSFKEIPDVMINKNNVEHVTSAVGVLRVDPFGFGLIPTWLNPAYHIGMKIAEWQVRRYNSAKEEAKALEFRLLQLKQLQQGKKDAKLDDLIEVTEGRVQKLKHELKEMEEAYA
jgi:hypothetical protein